ncbi:methyl-accepting chemotaxis protein, partial [Oscillospiraceae bacterium PP1C4]
EQSIALTQIAQGIEQISAVVQTNSATAEESAAASEELSGQASILKDMVGKYTLKKQTAFNRNHASVYKNNSMNEDFSSLQYSIDEDAFSKY